MIKTSDIFNIKNETDFQELALQVFNYQFNHNKVYRSFCDLLYVHPSDVKHINQIPFLPIQFFKTHEVLSSQHPIEQTFSSSGTTGSITSKHYVTDLDIYKQSFRKGFQSFYDNTEDYVILALLPSYLERDGSSLIYMVNDMITQSKHPESGFYLDDLDALYKTINKLDQSHKKVLLIGVSFALLDSKRFYSIMICKQDLSVK